MNPIRLGTTLALGLLTAASTGLAQQPADPMRPPMRDGYASPVARSAQPVVQTIIVGATQRYAVIDGRTVTQGDRVGEARVVRITESDVTLRDAAGRTSVIGLLPQVQKKSRPTALSDRSTAVP